MVSVLCLLMIHLHTIVSFRNRKRRRNRSLALTQDLPSVDDARNPAQDRETNVNKEISAAAGLEEDRDGWL
jgi:hypothetical protein